MSIYNRLLALFLFVFSCSFLPVKAASQTTPPLIIKILGVNDFHGQVSAGRRLNNRPVGSAAVLAAYLRDAQRGMEDKTLLALMGDSVGASPPASGLLHDEPTILFFNTLANSNCSAEARMNPRCNIVATVGNHEFDKGQKSMFDLIYGTDKKPTDDWVLLPHYPGAIYPYISANIIEEKTGKKLFPPYVIKKVNGVSVAFIGAILKDAHEVIVPSSIEGIKFLDEADAINSYIPEIKAQGATVIVVIIHQGGTQIPYEGDTQDNVKVDGLIANIVNRLDDNVDVVMAGHTHQFLNAILKNQHGKTILVTQANSYSTAFADVTLSIDPQTLSVINKSARIVTTYADEGPGLKPDPQADKLIKLAENKVEPVVNHQIGILKNDLIKKGNAAGESNLGNLIADAYKASLHTDITVNNPGGMRADLYAGKVTYGNLYAVQPFANYMVKMAFTGNEIYELLEQQWTKDKTIILQISGMSYTYNSTKPIGTRINTIFYENKPLVRDKIYTIVANNFLASGGDGFTVMKKGQILGTGVTDLEALVSYVKTLPEPFSMEIEGRIKQDT